MQSKPIYLISDGGMLRSRGELVARIAAALQEGSGRIGCIQLREQLSETSYPPASNQELSRIIEELLPVCRQHGASLLVNRRADLLARYDQLGAHYGGSLESFHTLRARHSDAVLGYSSHGYRDALAAAEEGADYILLAPVFAPLSKISARPPLGVAKLREITEAVSVPVIALGGITPERIPACRAAGAAGVALLSYVLLAEDPALAVRQAIQAWDDAA